MSHHYHAAAYHSSNAFGSIGHMVVSAIIHAAIWQAMKPLFHGQGVVGSIVIAVLIIAVIWIAGRVLGRMGVRV